jgi:hypothetical protein
MKTGKTTNGTATKTGNGTGNGIDVTSGNEKHD